MPMITPPARIGKYAPGVSPKPAAKPSKPLRRGKTMKKKTMPMMTGIINRAV